MKTATDTSDIQILKDHLKTTTQVNLPPTKGDISPKFVEAFSGKVKNALGEFKLIHYSQLKSFSGQRLPKAEKIKDMIQRSGGVDLHLVKPLSVAPCPEEDDMYGFYDGGHTFVLFRYFAPHIEYLPCFVIHPEDDKEVHSLFAKMNNHSASMANAEQCLINEIKGGDLGLEDIITILTQSGVVVWEHDQNFVMGDDDPNVIPQFQIKRGPLQDMEHDVPNAVWALDVYQQVFGQTRNDPTASPSMISSQVVRALQLIKQTYDEWNPNYDYTALINWFTIAVSTFPSAKKFQYTLEHPHERMEKRYTGTALGLIQDFNKTAAPKFRVPAYLIECKYLEHTWRRIAKESKGALAYEDLRNAFIAKQKRNG